MQMDPVDTLDLLRVSLLSLEGVELRWQQQPSAGGNYCRTSAVAAELRAYAGFDTPEDVQVSSLWCSQLLGHGGLATVESLPRNCVRAGTSEPLPLSSTVGGICWKEHGTAAPHAVVDLNGGRRSKSSDISEQRTTDVRVCVVGSRARRIDERPEGLEDDEFYNFGRGRVYCQAVATIRWDEPKSDDVCLPLTQAKNIKHVSNGDGYCIELSTGASLRVRIDKASVPRRELDKRKTDQYHYIDSKYRSSADGAPSVDDGGTIERSKECHIHRPPLKTRLGQLLSGSSAKRVPTTNETESHARQKRAGPPVQEVQFSPEEFGLSHLSQRRPSEDYSLDVVDERDDAPSSPPSTRKDSNGGTLDDRLGSARAGFLCGASLGWDMADAIQILGAAGHHCDEDHVGLYVASTEDSMGTSIGTR